MKRLIIAIAAAALIPSAAMANNTANTHRDAHNVRTDRQDLRHDRADIRHDRAEVRHDVKTNRVERHVINNRIRIGTRLTATRYAPRYAIAYPQRYRLAHAGYSQRWVRMDHDAVLVNLRTGRVVSVVYGRFG